MHSIKVKKLKAMVLKVDLKSYDRVIWSFLQLVLLQFNLRHEATNWVIGYIYLDNFVVSVNGVQSFFLESTMGYDKDAHYLHFFLLVIEGSSLLILKACLEGKLAGVNILEAIKIIHMFFVDDVLLFW